MCLNHPETIPPLQSMEKLSFMQLVPGVKKVGDCYHGFLLKPPGRVCVCEEYVFTMRCLGHILKPLHQTM